MRGDPKQIHQRYYYYALLSQFAQAQLAARATGTTVLGIKQSELRHVRVPWVPLDKQRKIASILAAYDDLIENNTRRIAILEEMARALYREWFVEFRFPGHAARAAGREALPTGWEMHELGALASDERRTVHPSAISAGTPYFGLEHLPRRSIALAEWGFAGEVQSTKLICKRGEILFGKIRPYLHKVGVTPIDAVCSTDAIVIVPRHPRYFGLVLGCVSSDEFVAHATTTSNGVNMPRAKWEVLAQYAVAVPPVSLLDRVNSFMGDITAQIANLIFRTCNLRTARDLLLPKLISGEIDVSDLAIDVGEPAA